MNRHIVEVRKKTSWCEPFVWIGMNPITIYLAYNIVNFQGVAQRVAGGDLQRCLDTQVGQGAGGVFLALVEVALMFTLARFLYVRKIFIRLVLLTSDILAIKRSIKTLQVA